MVNVSDDLRAEAVAVLRAVSADTKAPAAARAAAARTLLEMLGAVGRLQEKDAGTGTRALSEMSAVELDNELARLAPIVNGETRVSQTRRASLPDTCPGTVTNGETRVSQTRRASRRRSVYARL
jgi:hypothetical protein